jgi:hypothetical protein
VAIAVELQPERCPCGNPQVDQTKLDIQEIEIVGATCKTRLTA